MGAVEAIAVARASRRVTRRHDDLPAPRLRALRHRGGVARCLINLDRETPLVEKPAAIPRSRVPKIEVLELDDIVPHISTPPGKHTRPMMTIAPQNIRTV